MTEATERPTDGSSVTVADPSAAASPPVSVDADAEGTGDAVLEPPGVGSSFRPSAQRARATVVLLTITAVFAAVTAILDMALATALWRFDAGVTEGRTVLMFSWPAVGAAVISAVAYLATAVSFLFWLHRSMRNAPALGAEVGKYGPRSAIGVWFLPVANWILPYDLVRDLATRLAGSSLGRFDRWSIRAWWAAYVAIPWATIYALVAKNDQPTKLLITAIALVVETVAAILAINVVRRVQSLTDTREALLRRDDPGPAALGVDGVSRPLPWAAALVGAIGLVGIATAVAAKPSAQPWITFSPPTGGFEVLMPRAPTTSSSSFPTPAGAGTAHAYQVILATEQLTIATFDFPVGVGARLRAATDPVASLVAAVTGGRPTLSDRPISLDGVNGRDVTLRLPSGALDRIEFYFVEDRGYALEVLVSPGVETPPDVARFLDSFALRP